MGFPMKFDEWIESEKLSSHVRPRSASAAIGPNGPESAAMVCAMHVRAGKGINQNGHYNGLTAKPASRLQFENRTLQDATGGLVALETSRNTSLPAKCHRGSWFDTDNEASGLSDSEDYTDNRDDRLTQPAESSGVVLHPSINESKSPQSSRDSLTVAVHASSAVDAVPLDFSPHANACKYISTASSQYLDSVDAGIPSNSAAISLEIFAPNVLPWFKAKRK